ncbi:SubName: Full=Uncharacterized protein {ECO:0000313/EMBL:CCA73079.1} [Serendipita indica DSM 11827]|nr:SubName: Full=Uncharacterized protein {ECO:0000313/EMBL:CCA73079.1} [Serendipita indica DSM 11827]
MGPSAPKTGQEPSKPYEAKPPEWVTGATRDGDLGYHGYFPPRPGQDEDILSDNNILYGYTEPQFVTGELWQGTDTFRGVFKENGKNGLESLQEIMEKVMARRAELHAGVDANSFKLPSRVTLTGDKRTAWFKDLADPNVSLQKIAKSAVITSKSQETLEMLYVNNTPPDRTVWYIRALAVIEVYGRNKTSTQPSTATDWTNVITGYLKKQLVEIGITTVRTGSNIKQSFRKSKLSEADSRENWVSRFAFSLDILRLLFDGDLLDQPTFLGWIAAMASPSEGLGPHQFVFLSRIIDEYFDVVASNRAFATPVVEGCLAQWAEIEPSPLRQHGAFVLNEIARLVLRFLCVDTDCFLSRHILSNHSAALSAMVGHALQLLDPDSRLAMQDISMRRLKLLTERGNAILQMQIPPDEEAQDVEICLEDISTLNTIDTTTNLIELSFLPIPTQTPTGGFDFKLFSRRLSTLLSWSIHPDQSGDSEIRPYLASALILLWRQSVATVVPNVGQTLQRHLLTWLEGRGLVRPLAEIADSSLGDSPEEVEKMNATLTLFGELVHRRLFSFSDYLTRMASFGQISSSPPRGVSSSPAAMTTPGACTANALSRHLELLRCIPLWDKVSEQVLNQRKIVLYGIRARKTADDATEKEIRAEIRRVLPIFFNGPPTEIPFSMDQLPTSLSASKFVRVRVLHHWLFDLVKDYIARVSPMADVQQAPLLSLPIYTTLVQIFINTGCYRTVWELNQALLLHVTDRELLVAILSCLRCYLDLWVGMLLVDKISNALLDAHARLKEQVRQPPRRLLLLLSELKSSCVLSEPVKGRIDFELEQFEESQKLLFTDSSSSSPAPPLLPPIKAVIEENSLAKPVDLASILWHKNKTHADWGLAAWQATIMAICTCKWDPSLTDAEMADRFATFVWHIDAHLPHGIGDTVATWFETTGATSLLSITDNCWDIIKIMCYKMLLDYIVTPKTVLSGLIYPAVKAAVANQLEHPSDTMAPYLQRALDLFNLVTRCDSPVMNLYSEQSPIFMLDALCCRARCLHASNTGALLDVLSDLTLIEVMSSDGSDQRMRLEQLRYGVQSDPYLKAQLLSRADLVYNAFERNLRGHQAYSSRLIVRLRSLLDSRVSSAITPENATIETWATALNAVSVWTFPTLSVDIRLLRALVNDPKPNIQDNPSVTEIDRDRIRENLATALLDQKLSPAETALLQALLKDAIPALCCKIVTHGFKRLASLLEVPHEGGSLEQLLAFSRPLNQTLRLMLTFGRLRGPISPTQDLTSLQDTFLSSWMARTLRLRSTINSEERKLGGRDVHKVLDAICLMLRALHFFDEVAGPDLGPKTMELVTELMELAITVGGAAVYDEMTFNITVDTLCILYDDCKKETRPQILRALNERFSLTSLPPQLPAQSRIRLGRLVPFVPRDKYGANLAFAQRVDGVLELKSQARGRPWEWTDNIDPVEPPGILNTRIKNTSAVPLELFEVVSKGESILPESFAHEVTGKSGDIWSFRDTLASEGLMSRAWRESRGAWDARSLDGTGSDRDRVAGSGGAGGGTSSSMRGHSPAAASSSAHLSTSSRMASPSVAMNPMAVPPSRMQPLSMPTVETIIAEPVVESSNEAGRGLKRKARLDEEEGEDDDIIMLTERPAVGGKTTQKKPKAKTKSKK